ncbi:MAG: cupredoxin domain-containing protein, partial [Patescibacteria group bacterium]
MNKIFIWIIIIILAALGIWYFSSSSLNNDDKGEVMIPLTSPAGERGNLDDTDNSVEALPALVATRDFVVIGADFKFSPAEIKVKSGDRVKLTLKSSDMPHDWRVDELNLATRILQAGEEQTIEFTAGPAGTYEAYCSVGNHRAKG